MKSVDSFYSNQEEPVRSCFLALKDIILATDKDITNTLKYGMPFFCYKGKMFCYLWNHKKYKQPYIGFVEGNRLDYSFLLKGKRSRMKIMLLDPTVDLPIRKIKKVLNEAVGFYKSGLIKIK